MAISVAQRLCGLLATCEQQRSIGPFLAVVRVNLGETVRAKILVWDDLNSNLPPKLQRCSSSGLVLVRTLHYCCKLPSYSAIHITYDLTP